MFKTPAAPPPEPAAKPVKKQPMRPPIRKKKTNWVLWGLVIVAVILAVALILFFLLK